MHTSSQHAPAPSLNRKGHSSFPSLDELAGLVPAARAIAAAVFGVASSFVVLGLVQWLPANQVIHVLGALAGGIALLMVVASLRDRVVARAILRAAVAAAAGATAYAALPFGWGLLGLAYAGLTAWALMDWIGEGGGPAAVILTTGLGSLALLVLSNV